VRHEAFGIELEQHLERTLGGLVAAVAVIE
jgi:hypothetical protein